MPDRAGLKPARVFLALWPNEAVRDRLATEGGRLHKALGGKLTRPATIHLTLVFIGELARRRLAGLIRALHSVSVPAFELAFDRADCWRHNRIAFLAPGQPPETLFQLVSVLEDELKRLDVPFDLRPYKPHVTLLRKANCNKRDPADGGALVSPEWGDFAPVIWPAAEFVLVESVPVAGGVEYRPLERFPLS